MAQFQIEGHTLKLSVKKGPLIIRSTLFLFALLFFISPFISIALSVSNKPGLRLGFILMPIFFGLMGFYLLRVALWNTFGKEIISFENEIIKYNADYGWFKDGKKEIELLVFPEFQIQKRGYDDDKKGVLLINIGDHTIKCVTVMPIHELEEVQKRMRSLLQSGNHNSAVSL